MAALKKLAVTGASGMVGRHVILYASDRGLRCAASSRRRPESLPATATWRKWDLCHWQEPDDLDALFGDVDALLHIGAITPRKSLIINYKKMFNANVRACLCLGTWALRKNIPVVYLSGSTSYADPECPGIKENFPLAHPAGKLGGFYGFTKLLGEEVFIKLAAEGLKLGILRPSSIYGTGLPDDQMISMFFNRALQGKNIKIQSPSGSQVNLIHALDVAAVMVTMIQKKITGTFNIAAPKVTPVRKIAQTVLDICGKGGAVIQLKNIKSRPFVRFDLDCSAAKKTFGFKTRVSLEKGLGLMKNKAFGTLEEY